MHVVCTLVTSSAMLHLAKCGQVAHCWLSNHHHGIWHMAPSSDIVWLLAAGALGPSTSFTTVRHGDGHGDVHML
jgi:hypothetical protein